MCHEWLHLYISCTIFYLFYSPKPIHFSPFKYIYFKRKIKNICKWKPESYVLNSRVTLNICQGKKKQCYYLDTIVCVRLWTWGLLRRALSRSLCLFLPLSLPPSLPPSSLLIGDYQVLTMIYWGFHLELIRMERIEKGISSGHKSHSDVPTPFISLLFYHLGKQDSQNWSGEMWKTVSPFPAQWNGHLYFSK